MKKKIVPLEIFFSLIITICIFSIIILMCLEIGLYKENITKKIDATTIASNILENIKTRSYENIEQYIEQISSIGISKTLENNALNIIVSGKDFTGTFFGTSIPEDYEAKIIIENSNSDFDIAKNISVIINYEINNQNQNITLSSTIERENVKEYNSPIINDQYFKDLNINTYDYDIIPIKYLDNTKEYVTTTKDDKEWFNYYAKKWAKVVVFAKDADNLKDFFIDETGKVKNVVNYNGYILNITNYMYVWIPNFSIKDNIAYFRYGTGKRCIRMGFLNQNGKYLYLNRVQEEIADVSPDCSFEGIYGVWRKLGDTQDEYYKTFNLTKFAPIDIRNINGKKKGGNMSNFICKVITPQGQIVKIKMQEKDKIACIKKIKRNGMTPISIKSYFSIFKLNNKKYTNVIQSKKTKTLKINIDKNYEIEFSNKVGLKDIREFTENFYLLKKSNFTNSHALLTIINKTENSYLKEALKDILKNVDNGKYIYKAMKEHENIFPKIYVNLIKTGELTESLDESLKYCITYLEDEEKIKNTIKNELLPNIILFCGIFITLILAILIGIPSIQNVFSSYGNNFYVPKVTLFVIDSIRYFAKHWYIVVLLIAIIVAILIKLINTDTGKYKFDKFKYTNFLFGRIKFLVDFSRVIRSIFLNLQTKVRIQDALEISKSVINNVYMLDLIEKSINDIYVGKSWLTSFENEELLDPMTIEMLKKGFNVQSREIIQELINYLDKEIKKEVDRILKILPEISYGAVGISILLFIIIVLIPYMQIYLGSFLVM